MAESTDLPRDVLMAAASVVIMLPPFKSVEETGNAVERVARVIMAERERCAAACDQWLVMFGKRGDELKHTTPQDWANSAVDDIASAIRKRGEG